MLLLSLPFSAVYFQINPVSPRLLRGAPAKQGAKGSEAPHSGPWAYDVYPSGGRRSIGRWMENGAAQSQAAISAR
jgi:hypothetical protein